MEEGDGDHHKHQTCQAKQQHFHPGTRTNPWEPQCSKLARDRQLFKSATRPMGMGFWWECGHIPAKLGPLGAGRPGWHWRGPGMLSPAPWAGSLLRKGRAAPQGCHLRHHSTGEQTRTHPRVGPQSRPGAQADTTALDQELEMGPGSL